MIWAPGLPGPQGAAGAQGSAGAQGAAGNQGFQGAAGATGTQGAQGDAGLTGAQGTAGAQGATGAQGSAGSGVVLQVIEGTGTTSTTIASTTYTDINLSASITPSSSSNRVLITISAQCTYTRTATPQAVGIKVLRDSTQIYASAQISGEGPLGEGLNASGATGISRGATIAISFTDSPATTSAVTYKVQGAVRYTTNSGSSLWNSSQTGQNGKSYIILQELTP